MFKAIGVILRHEIRDFIRDRSTLKTMFLLLIFMPILFSYIIGDLGNMVQDAREKDKIVGYVDSARIKDMLPFLRQQGLKLVPVKTVDKKTFSDQKLDALIRERPKDQLDSPDLYQANIELWTSGTNQKQMLGARYIQNMVASYGQMMGKRMMIMRGVSPQLSEPIHLETKSISSDNSSGFATLDLLISLFGMAIFYSTLHLAVDTTAGERERLTLESLFYTAAPRSAFVFGKWLLVTGMVFFASWLVGTIFWMLGEFSIFQEVLGRTETFPYSQVLKGLIIFFPLCPMIAAMQIMIGSLSQSVKQAQAFNGVSGLLSLPLSFLLFVEDVKALTYVPIFGQGLAFRSILHGEEFNAQALLVTEVSTIALGAIMLGLVLRRFNREKIIYSG